MPDYRVKTDQGDFKVTLDQAPASVDELRDLVTKHMAGVPERAQVADNMGYDVNRAAETGGSLMTAQKEKEAFTTARQQSAIQEPTFQKFAGATIPTAAGLASMIPGVGPLAGAAIQAGGTAANQLAGFEPYSTTEIAKSAAIPLAAQGVVGAAKGATKALGKFFNPGATRTAGVEAAVESTGAVPNAMERAYTVPASKAAYQTAAQQGDVPLGSINQAITDSWDKLTNMANAPTRATKYLENLSNKYAGKPLGSYDDLKNELQLMRQNANKAFAQKDSVTGTSLMEARSNILNEMDKISPKLREANAIYKKEQSTEEVARVLSNPRPDVKLGELFLNDPLVRSSFSKEDAQFMERIAKEVSTMGTQASPYSGVGAKMMNLIATPLAQALHSKSGMYLLRQTFKDGHVTPAGLATVAQFMRAYKAQGGED